MNGYGVSPLELLATEAMLQGVVNLDEFVYSAVYASANNTQLTSGATIDVQILINSDADFLVQERNIIAFDGAAPPVVVADPNILVTITRAGSGKQVMNSATHVENYFGNYSSNHVPGRMTFAVLIPKSQVLTVRLQNLGTTNFSRVDVSFVGMKVFYTQNAKGEVGTRSSVFNMLDF